jgi:hypothetical protein
MKVLPHPLRSARLAPLLLLLLAVVVGRGGLGCAETQASPGTPAEALRRNFPDQAPAVLAPSGEAVVSTPEGFARRSAASSPHVERGV